jgi:hypothetical protein
VTGPRRMQQIVHVHPCVPTQFGAEHAPDSLDAALQVGTSASIVAVHVPEDPSRANSLLTTISGVPAEFTKTARATGTTWQVRILADGSVDAIHAAQAMKMLGRKKKSRDQLAVGADLFVRAQAEKIKAKGEEEAALLSFFMHLCAPDPAHTPLCLQALPLLPTIQGRLGSTLYMQVFVA